MTGGIGLLLGSGASGPEVLGIVSGSPADAAGIHIGDVIEEIDGVTTAGLPLVAVADRFDGVVGTSVAIMVRTSGTRVKLSVARRAWRNLKSLPTRT